MAHGLQHLHALRIAHRDLKMDNMLLKVDASGRQRLKLADFGFSKEMGHNRVLATKAYADVYQPPEIILGQGYSLSADIWVFGVLIHELLTGTCLREDPSLRGNQIAAVAHYASQPLPTVFPSAAWQVFCSSVEKGSTAERLQRKYQILVLCWCNICNIK